MKNYLLVRSQNTPAEPLPVMGNIREVFSAEDAIQALENRELLNAVVIDTPSEIPEIQKVIAWVNDRNSDLLAFPILILTDEKHIEKDEGYLGGVVVDCVMKPVRPAVMKNRLANAEQLVSSVSFTEFSKMLQSLPANVYLKDNRGRYVFSSQTWHHLNTDDDPDWTIRGKTDLDIRKDKENARRALESDLELIRTGKGTSYIIEEYDKAQEFLQIIKEPLFYEDGRVRGIIALINIVTEQEQMRRKLRERYITDQLTRVYNRSYYTEYLAELEWKAPDPLSIIIADCDNLKHVNDTCGHIAGDDYIRACADLMRGCLPKEALIFRTGGDEFAAFLPEIGAEEAERLVEQIRDGQGKYSIDGNRLSVSIGCSTMTGGRDLKRSIGLADQRMYEEKQSKKRL
jgi:diguanylate cyclase (GGDEF)-like protein